MSVAAPTPTACIASLATAHPPFRMSRDEWLAIADAISPREVDRAVLARLAERSGVESRWCAAFDEGRLGFYKPDEIPGTAERMALWLRAARAMTFDAATGALARAASAGVRPNDVTHLVTASCTGFAAPGIDAFLIERLGLSKNVTRLNVGFMGCHAAINALAVARSTILANRHAVVLVTMAEVSTAHFHHHARLDQLIANTLFADGCAAMIVTATAADHASREHTRRDHTIATLHSTHSVLIPETATEMAWSIGNNGFEMTLGARVPDILARDIRAWVERALATHGLTIASIKGWAIHPGGPRVIDAVAAALGLSDAAVAPSRAVLRDFGNMSSATLPFILERLAREDVPKPWVALAFGPGLAGEMLVCAE